MAFRKAMWLPSISYIPEDDRLSMSALWYPSGNSSNFLSVRAGVIPRFVQASGGPLQVVASVGMAANVLAGQMIYPGANSTTQGAYIVTNDATTSVTFTTANATNPRIDVVYVRVLDANEGDASSNTQILVQAGTPAVSPAVPAIPTGCYALAQVLIPASSSSVTAGNITDKRTFTTTLGSPLLCTSTTRPSNPFDGQEIFETDSRIRWVWELSTSTWRPITTILYAASTSRPATGLPTGMRLTETDTGLNYQWNGSKWLRDVVHQSLPAAFNSTVTAFADTGFTFSGEANAVYVIDSWLHVTAPVANDLSLQWVLPTGATIEWTLMGPSGGNTGGSTDTTMWQSGVTTTGPLTIGGLTGANSSGMAKATITMGSTAGTCKIQGAQAVAGGTSTLRASSWMTIKQTG